MARSIETEIERNYAAFLDMLGGLIRENEGRYALLHDQKLKGLFDGPGDAARAGFALFGDHNYSVQLITDEPADLGFYSHALPAQ